MRRHLGAAAAILLCACTRSEQRPVRACRLPWSLAGEMVCEDDLPQLSETWRARGVGPAQIRPGTRYVLGGAPLWVRGVMDPRWLRDLEVPVWLHGDPRRRLRSLPGLGSRRLAALQQLCPAHSCCDPCWVRGVGPKTVAGWGSRVVYDLRDAPCLGWDGAGFTLQPCIAPTHWP